MLKLINHTNPPITVLSAVGQGRPRAVLDHCSYSFDGSCISPLADESMRGLHNLVLQWKSSGLDCVAFSYRSVEVE